VKETVMNVWLILLGIVVIAALYVVLPVAVTTFSHYRRAWRLRCPADGAAAQIVIDAPRAAIGEVLGRPTLEVAHCSLWPRLRLCKQECLALRASEMHPVRKGAPAPGATPDTRLRKILVPLDGSPGSTSVLWTVGQLARAQAARVRLLRVASPVSSARQHRAGGLFVARRTRHLDPVVVKDGASAHVGDARGTAGPERQPGGAASLGHPCPTGAGRGAAWRRANPLKRALSPATHHGNQNAPEANWPGGRARQGEVTRFRRSCR
jgi:hypothetical protein